MPKWCVGGLRVWIHIARCWCCCCLIDRWLDAEVRGLQVLVSPSLSAQQSTLKRMDLEVGIGITRTLMLLLMARSMSLYATHRSAAPAPVREPIVDAPRPDPPAPQPNPQAPAVNGAQEQTPTWARVPDIPDPIQTSIHLPRHSGAALFVVLVVFLWFLLLISWLTLR
jgi:hypothetical protein